MDEPSVVAGEAQEATELCSLSRDWVVGDSGNLVRVHLQSGRRDDVAEVRDRRPAENTFGGFESETRLSEMIEDKTQPSQVISKRRRVDDNVIQVGQADVPLHGDRRAQAPLGAGK